MYRSIMYIAIKFSMYFIFTNKVVEADFVVTRIFYNLFIGCYFYFILSFLRAMIVKFYNIDCSKSFIKLWFTALCTE